MKKTDQSSALQLLGRLWAHLNSRRRKQFGGLLLLMIFTSFAEVISIGSVIPFLGVLTNSKQIFESRLAESWIIHFNIDDPNQLLLLFAFFFGLSALSAGVMRLLLLWANTRLSFGIGSDLCMSIYRRTLYQPYDIHISRNSSEIINGILNKIGAVIIAISSTLNLLGSFVILATIVVALLSIDSLIALMAFAGFGLIYVGIFWLTRNTQLEQSQLIARESTQVVKLLQEGLGGIRDILLDGTQETFCHIYQRADASLRRAQGNVQFISLCPRYGMESLGMVLIVTLAIVLFHQGDGVAKAIPVLGALALGLQRALPMLQQAYQAWSNIQGSHASIEDALQFLDQPLPSSENGVGYRPFKFSNDICIHELSFRYQKESPWILKNINLKISKGSRVGFIGTTGAGKSTLLDIIMSLLTPSKGDVRIDGIPINSKNKRLWQSHIAHVPQNIYLADASIRENIAFGVHPDAIDFERVVQAASRAQLADTIDKWEKGYETVVGERGIRLSGGQRQRIGIARALYKNAEVIIFDEATSALDSETEQAVMEAIENLDKNLTVLIIAHRVSTLRKCNQIVELVDGGVKSIGNYQSFTSLT